MSTGATIDCDNLEEYENEWAIPTDEDEGAPRAPAPRGMVNQEVLQNAQILQLRHEVLSLRRLVDMLLVLVDPEDVQAALEARQKTPSNAELLRYAEESEPPEWLADEPQAERPW